MNVAVFGGSFDPPHVGHVLLAAYLGTVAGFDQVLVIPVFGHAFHKDLTPFEHRLRMCQIAFARLPFVQVSPVESTLPAPNFTLHTLEAIKQAHPNWQLRLAIGSDVLAEAAQWHRFDAVCALAPPFVLSRRGHDQQGNHRQLLPQVSSTELRENLRHRGDARAREMLAEMIPGEVLSYVDSANLYTRPEA